MAKPAVVGGVTITHPDRVVYPIERITKLDIVRYYDSVADRMLPHLVGRPLTLVACMTGITDGCQYLRHSKVWGPKVIRRVRIREKTKIGEYMIADTVEGLLALAQLNVLELHTWNVDFDHDVERPNRIVFDLDPGPEISWPQVIVTARMLRKLLLALAWTRGRRPRAGVVSTSWCRFALSATGRYASRSPVRWPNCWSRRISTSTRRSLQRVGVGGKF